MTPKKILVPVDFSQASEQALDYACSLASTLGATVYLVNAIGHMLPELSVTLTNSMLQALRDSSQLALEKLADPRRALVPIAPPQVKEGDPRDVILASAEELDIDLIVIGTHGRRGLARMFLGSVAEEVSRRSRCPVLLVGMRRHHPAK